MMHARVSRESVTTEEIRDATRRDDVSIFPIAIPLLAGPGAITTVILVMKTGSAIELKILVILAILLTFALSYLVFRFANRINKTGFKKRERTYRISGAFSWLEHPGNDAFRF